MYADLRQLIFGLMAALFAMLNVCAGQAQFSEPPRSMFVAEDLSQFSLLPGEEIPPGQIILGPDGVPLGEPIPPQWFEGGEYFDSRMAPEAPLKSWDWQALPSSLIYRSYLAGPRESRFAGLWKHDNEGNWRLDVALGGRVGILRYGAYDDIRPEGWQLDIEGAVFPRLDLDNDWDLLASDYRFGVPLTYGIGSFQAKLAYYHLSSHLGDEFLLRSPGITRINYRRDEILLGGSMYWTDALRMYGEAGYAFSRDGGAEPWEIQTGVEFSPLNAWIAGGSPFAAVNGYLREEVDFGGTLTVQLGWQWRGTTNSHLLRTGFEYLNGKSAQLQFFREHEEQFSYGVWYDY